MIVLDASVLIAHLDAHDAHHDAATRLLDEADDDLGASPLTLAEVLVGPARHGALTLARQALAQLQVEELALPVNAAGSLAELRAATRLRLPDCGVLLAAEQSTGAVATFDSRLASVARVRGLTVFGVG